MTMTHTTVGFFKLCSFVLPSTLAEHERWTVVHRESVSASRYPTCLRCFLWWFEA